MTDDFTERIKEALIKAESGYPDVRFLMDVCRRFVALAEALPEERKSTDEDSWSIEFDKGFNDCLSKVRKIMQGETT